MLPVIISGILSTLLQNNLPKVADAVLNKGIDYVQEKMGIELKPDMTPEEIKVLQESAQRHEEFKIEQAHKNTDSARNMQNTAANQDDLFTKRFTLYLASFWSLAAVVYIAFITFGYIPEANVRFADTILGFILGTIVATIINFFFGSSASSKEKTDKLVESIRNEPKP